MKEITIDVLAPAISQRFDFVVSVDVTGEQLKQEIVRQIKQATGYASIFPNIESLKVMCKNKGEVNPNIRLSEQNVSNGDTLLLI